MRFFSTSSILILALLGLSSGQQEESSSVESSAKPLPLDGPVVARNPPPLPENVDLGGGPSQKQRQRPPPEAGFGGLISGKEILKINFGRMLLDFQAARCYVCGWCKYRRKSPVKRGAQNKKTAACCLRFFWEKICVSCMSGHENHCAVCVLIFWLLELDENSDFFFSYCKRIAITIAFKLGPISPEFPVKLPGKK